MDHLILEGMDNETRTEFKKVHQKFGRVDVHLNRIDDRIDNIGGHLESIDGRLDSIYHRFDANDERFDAMDISFDNHGCRLNNLEETQERIILEVLSNGSRLDRIEQTMATRNDITAILEGQDHMLQILKRMETEQAATRVAVDRHEKQIERLNRIYKEPA